MKFLQMIMCLLCLVVPFSTSDSEFMAAVYEHAFVSQLKNKTDVPTKQEALRIVMDNMDVYEKRILDAKSKVRINSG